MAIKFLLMSLLINSVVAYFNNEICTKGNLCVEIRKCSYFDGLLNSAPIPRPKYVIRLIREHQCGFAKNIPKVCCSASAVRSDKVQQFNVDQKLLQHPNLHLLPNELCGTVYNDFRITNGWKASLLEFPWMALLLYNINERFDFKCAGTVINSLYVLTAAHCVINLNVVGVRLGDYNIATKTDCDTVQQFCSPPVQDFFIETITIHPEYDSTSFQNDIALIRLATPAKFNENVLPICLPLNRSPPGKFMTVTGWGITEKGHRSDKLLKASIPVVPEEICRRYYANSAPITHKQICAGGYLGRDSCAGDSGGPLQHVEIFSEQVRYVQHGIVSFGPKHCGIDGHPGVYTKISHYSIWILDNLKPVLD